MKICFKLGSFVRIASMCLPSSEGINEGKRILIMLFLLYVVTRLDLNLKRYDSVVKIGR